MTLLDSQVPPHHTDRSHCVLRMCNHLREFSNQYQRMRVSRAASGDIGLAPRSAPMHRVYRAEECGCPLPHANGSDEPYSLQAKLKIRSINHNERRPILVNNYVLRYLIVVPSTASSHMIKLL